MRERVVSNFLPDSLRVNVEEIDQQHEALFSCLAELKEICLDTGELPDEQAETLLSTLREHCATEEQLAGEAGLDFSRHAGKHQTMLKAIDKAVHELSIGKRDAFGLLRYIEYWFERHISEEDLILGANLQQVCDGLFDPEQQFTLARAATLPPHAAHSFPFHP